MTMIHWSISYLSKFQVDSVPIENSLEKNAVTDHSFAHYTSLRILKSIYPKFVPHLHEVNKLILDDLHKIIHVDHQLFYQVYQWNQHENTQKQNNNSNTNNSIHSVPSTDSTTNAVNNIASQVLASQIRSSISATATNRMSMASATAAAAGLEGMIELVPVSLSILSDEKILNLILSIQHHRQELLSSLVSKKLLLRERNNYFHIFQEVLTMSYDYLKFCSNFLPNECFSPYALTIQAMKTNLIPSLMKYGMKNGIRYSNFSVL
jgi:hypothetical protein